MLCWLLWTCAQCIGRRKVFNRFLYSLGRSSIVRTKSLCWNNKLIDNDHSILNLFMRHLTLPNSFNLLSPQPFHEAPDSDMFVIINSQFLFWTCSIALSIYILCERCSYLLSFLSLIESVLSLSVVISRKH